MAKTMKIKTRDIAIAAIFLSLILIFVLVPMPNPLGVSMAFIPLIAVILAADVQGFGMGLFAGTAFGIASLINAFLHPTLMAPMFYNPLVSIVPRMISPITTYFTFKFVKKLLSKRSDDASTYIAATVSSVVAVCTNTALVLAMMAAFNFGKTFGSTTINAAFFGGLLGVNFVFEIAICAFAAPIITTGLRIALGLDKKGNKPVEEEGTTDILSEEKESEGSVLSKSLEEAPDNSDFDGAEEKVEGQDVDSSQK